jgi:site-specific DNA recombinase
MKPKSIDGGAFPSHTSGVSGAVLYLRVSTAEQADQAHNPPTQKLKVEERCGSDGMTIVKAFTDAGESARTTDRPQFQAMMDYCRKHKGKITHVVFADLSRLARKRFRSISDSGNLQAARYHSSVV